MIRLPRLAAAGALLIGLGTTTTACHENLTTREICDAFKPHAYPTDVLWDYEFRFGVSYCDAAHLYNGQIVAHHNYCVFPDGAHWFTSRTCDGPS